MNSLDRPGFPPPPLPHYDPGPVPLGRVPWRWWEPILVFLFTFVSSGVLGVAAAWLVSRGVDCIDPSAATRGRCDIANSVVIAIFELSLGAWALIWVKVRWNGGPRLLGLGSERLGSNIGVGLAAGGIGFVAGPIVTGLLFEALTRAISDKRIEQPMQLPFEGTPHWLALVITGVSVIIFAPIAEELFFRGFLYQGLRRKLPVVGAGIISALIFGAAHIQPPFGLGLLLLIPAITVLGFILAWIFERRSSLVPSMTAHALFNIIGFSIYLFTIYAD